MTVGAPRTNPFCAIFAIVLALTFAGSSLSSAIDGIQHAVGGSFEHEHLAFGDQTAISDRCRSLRAATRWK